MALKNLGFLKNLKIPNLGFFLNKKLMSDLSFWAFFTYYATNLIEMLSNFPINMNCIFAFTWPNLCSQLFYGPSIIRAVWHGFKKPRFFGFFFKNLKSPNLGFLVFFYKIKNQMSDLSF